MGIGFIVPAVLLAPVALLVLEGLWKGFGKAYRGLALAALLYAQIVIAMAVYRTVRDHTVFMTDVHEVLLNPLFLAAGAYLGVYLTYRAMRPYVW